MGLNFKRKLEKNNDKKILVLSLTFVFMFMVIVIPLFNKGTYSVDDPTVNTDSLVLGCPDTAIGDEEVVCGISLNSASMITQGMTIKYKLPEGVEYVDFTTDNFEVYSNDEDGIVLVNVDGFSGDVVVGNLKLKMPTDAVSNSIYKIELIDSTIGDGADTVVELDDVFAEIRIKSDINTLDSIALSNGVINETFDKNTLEYTATTDSDKLTINVVKSDERSTVSGDVDIEKELHYGTNTLNIVVTSESGIDKTYKVNVYRTYKFSTNKYLYNEEDNYIYVGTDTDNLLSNLDEEDTSGLNRNIDTENNVLVISYNEEKLLEIDILSISLDKFRLVDNTLYVDKEYSIEELSLNIEHTEGITFELDESDVVKILYGEDLLNSYKLVVYNLKFNTGLGIDEDNKYVKNIELGTTIDELIKEKITLVGGSVRIYDKNGNEKNVDQAIYTGDIFKVYLGESVVDEYVLSVLGDSSGDGRMSATDLAQFRKHIVDWVNPETGIEFELKGIYCESLDLDKDGRVSIVDLALMRKMIVGLI